MAEGTINEQRDNRIQYARITTGQTYTLDLGNNNIAMVMCKRDNIYYVGVYDYFGGLFPISSNVSSAITVSVSNHVLSIQDISAGVLGIMVIIGKG